MRFAVPQFIDVEDKIFGPLTLKQAIYVVGGIGLAIFIFTRFGIFWTVLLGGPIGLLGFALAFAKVNNRPFISIVYAATFYAVKTKLYLWKKVARMTSTTPSAPINHGTKVSTPKLSQSRLRELAWTLDAKQTIDN